jgi:hypothetical protein
LLLVNLAENIRNEHNKIVVALLNENVPKVIQSSDRRTVLSNGNKVEIKVFKGFLNFNLTPWQDSISRPRDPKADTVPLDHNSNNSFFVGCCDELFEIH